MNIDHLRPVRYRSIESELEKQGFRERWGKDFRSIHRHLRSEVRRKKSRLCIDSEGNLVRFARYVDLQILRPVYPTNGTTFHRLKEVGRKYRGGKKGKTPHHDGSISIKMLTGERPGVTVQRGLREELGLPMEAIKKLRISKPVMIPVRRDIDLLSRSFPGLPAWRRKFESITVLPKSLFRREANYEGTRRHRKVRFEWLPTDEFVRIAGSYRVVRNPAPNREA